MKVITATMAKNISNDFLNNKCGIVIKGMMDTILLKASQGEHSASIRLPEDWSMELKANVGLFFGNLGYEVDQRSCALYLKW